MFRLNTNLIFITSHTLKKGRVVDTNTHSCHELVFYCYGCNGVITIDGVDHKISAGDISVVTENIQHSEKHFSDVECLFFGFESDEEIESRVYHNVWDAKPIIQSIIKESIEQKYEYKSIINLKIQEIMLLLKRSMDITSKTDKSKSLFYCKNYIDENYMYKINISDLAKMAGYSIDHFRHLFYRNFNISPYNYIIQVRCKKAVELLKTTSYKCVDIAYKCGFSDSCQMTKMIKKYYSMTSQQIRQQ